MAYPDYKRGLLSEDFDPNYMLDRFFHTGQSAVFIGAQPDEEANFKNDVATIFFSSFHIRIHPFQIVITGSAHLGFSPVPSKLGKPFNPSSSDIDLAIVSPELFDSWWTELQSSGLVQAVRETVAHDLFWGFINPSNVRDVSEHGSRWWRMFGSLRTDRAAGVRGRLYRTFWSMQSYHKLAIYRGRQELLAQHVTAQPGAAPDAVSEGSD
jgi:hypothetical protein